MKKISISIFLLTILITIPNQLFPRFGMHVGWGGGWGWGGPRVSYWGNPYYHDPFYNSFGLATDIALVESMRPRTQAEIDAEERMAERRAAERQEREERRAIEKQERDERRAIEKQEKDKRQAIEKQIRQLDKDIKNAQKNSSPAKTQQLEKEREALRNKL